MPQHELGPNASQAIRFLDRVTQLNEEDWRGIEGLQPIALSAFGECEWSTIELTAFRSLHEAGATALLEGVQRRLPPTLPPQLALAATTATMSLALSGELEDTVVIAGYGPFTEVIPSVSLGDGLAPVMPPPPTTPWARFVTRFRAVDNWMAPVELAYSVQHAVGVVAIDAAIEATNPEEPEFLQVGQRDLLAIVDEKMRTQTRGFDLIGSALKQPEFSEAHKRRFETLGDTLWIAAARALMAVQSYRRMPDKEFAILYTPFASAIPIRSLWLTE